MAKRLYLITLDADTPGYRQPVFDAIEAAGLPIVDQVYAGSWDEWIAPDDEFRTAVINDLMRGEAQS